MKTIKKLLALVMVMAMALAVTVPAMATNTEAPTTGSITVSNAEEGHTYDAYQIFSAVTDGEGNDTTTPTNSISGHVAYYATENQQKYWKDKGLFTFTKVGGGDNYVVGLAKIEGSDKDITAEEIGKYFNTNKEDIIANAHVEKQATATCAEGSSTVVLENLALGYYFVTSNNASIVSIDTTNNNVTIEDKNNYSDPFDPGHGDNPDGQLKDVFAVNGKEVYKDEDGNEIKDTQNVSVKIGDVVTYQVSTSTSNHVTKNAAGELDTTGNVSEKVTYVYITDTLGAGLTYNDDITVKVGENPLTADTDYIYKQEGNKFTLVIRWVDANGDSLYPDGSVVTAQYTATVNDKIDVVDAEGKPAANANNAAKVTIDSTPDNGEKPGPDPDPNPGEGTNTTTVDTSNVGVYVYAMAILKVDANDNTPLADAHFTVAKKVGDQLGEALKFTKHAEDGVYYYDKDGTTELVSDAQGRIVIRGLDDGKYIATETQAPTGYNMLTDTPELTTAVAKEAKSINTVTTTVYKDAEGNVVDTKTETTTETAVTTNTISDTTIKNGQGTELPSTGGIGTTIFYVVGGLLVVGAGVLLITKKRIGE